MNSAIRMVSRGSRPVGLWIALSLLVCLGLAASPALAADRSWSAVDRPRAEVVAKEGSASEPVRSLALERTLRDLRALLDQRGSWPRPKGSASDPVGDTFGSTTTPIDIVELTADVFLDIPVIFVTFDDPVSPGDSGLSNAVVGFIDIDVDQDGTTGDSPRIDLFNPGGANSGMGNEYYIDLFTYSSGDGAANVVDDVTDTIVGRTPVVFGGNEMAVIIDPVLIGMDDGAIDVATVLGSVAEPTDVAPNSGSVASDTSTLLQGTRFRTSVEWQRVPTAPGLRPARVSDFRTADSANFYFVNPNNLEFLIKVLNGCNRNGHFWVFFGGATDVEFTVTVEDLGSGQVRQYTNPQGQPADAITDTTAFATCP